MHLLETTFALLMRDFHLKGTYVQKLVLKLKLRRFLKDLEEAMTT